MLQTVLLLVLLVLLLVFLFVLASALVGFAVTKMPFVRTPRKVLLEIFKQLPLKEGQVFFDLGSGDGIVIFTAEELVGLRAYGFERTLWSHLFAKLKAKFKGSSAQFSRRDFLKEYWGEVDVFYAYLFPHLMPRVEEKFLMEAKHGAKLVTCDFALPNLKPTYQLESKTGYTMRVYQKNSNPEELPKI